MTAWENEPNEEGLYAAMRYAGWELGSPSWAQTIIYYYLNPEAANASMDGEGIPQRPGRGSAW